MMLIDACRMMLKGVEQSLFAIKTFVQQSCFQQYRMALNPCGRGLTAIMTTSPKSGFLLSSVRTEELRNNIKQFV